MLTRRGALAVVSAAVLTVSTSLLAQGRGTPQPKLTDAQKKDMMAMSTMVDAAMAGQAETNDLGLAWVHDDILKATNSREYVPFTVSLDPSKATGGPLSVYWRAVSKEAAAAAAAAAAPAANGKKDDKKDDKKNAPRPAFAYEDIGTTTVAAGQTGPAKLSRSFTVAAGTYDVYVLVKEPTPDKKGAPAPKISLIKQTVTVPELWSDELNTSSVIVAERIDPLPAPLNSQQMIERPYALGAMEIVPVTSNKFTKKAELQPFILIYNAKTDSANKPDVTVEYNFYSKDASGEKFFNKTTPQELNAKTLPPQFDFAAGHQLQSGQAIPLATFPDGDYRLEIKVTDKIANNKTVTRDVNFSVSGS